MSKKPYDKFLVDLMEFIKTRDYVQSKDIPNIDLYMDQVTTFMDDHLGLFKRSEEEKILTKTMINNYSKFEILPPTYKKKYTNDHMILLLFVYYFKNILSIPDIKALLDPIKDILMKDNAPVHMDEFLDRIMTVQTENFDSLVGQIKHTVHVGKDVFPEFNEEEQEKLSIFTTAYLLSIQATAQKHLATQLIDNYLNRKAAEPEEKKPDRPKADKTKTDKSRTDKSKIDKATAERLRAERAASKGKTPPKATKDRPRKSQP